MSQQVNLLAHEVRPPMLSALRALLVAGLLIPPILFYGAYVWVGTIRLASTVAQNDQGIAAERSRQKALTQEIGNRTTPVDLPAQLDAYKPLASQSQEILNLLRRNTDKGSEGYADHLTLLARISEDGLWLTSVKISNAGKTINLAGNSLRKETVLKYAQRLNEQFAPHGVRFTALEMTPESARESASNTPLSAVAFKLN